MATLSLIRFTQGLEGYGYQEESEAGIRLYAEDGTQYAQIPNCDWEFVCELGRYRDGDSDEFWSLVEGALSPITGWMEVGEGLLVHFTAGEGVATHPDRVSIHGIDPDAPGAAQESYAALEEGLAAVGYRLSGHPDRWEAGEGEDEQVCHLSLADVEAVGPLPATYYVSIVEPGSRRVYEAQGLHQAVRDAHAYAAGIPAGGGRVVVSLEDPRSPAQDPIPLVVVRR